MRRQPTRDHVRRALAADRRAFDALYETSLEQVWAFVGPRVRSRRECERMVAAILERAFAGAEPERRGFAWDAWLRAVAMQATRGASARARHRADDRGRLAQ
jgi:DNA-directed RNA polymerase specialized sigma24 family protein